MYLRKLKYNDCCHRNYNSFVEIKRICNRPRAKNTTAAIVKVSAVISSPENMLTDIKSSREMNNMIRKLTTYLSFKGKKSFTTDSSFLPLKIVPNVVPTIR